MLKITSDGRRAALDLRLVGERPDLAGGKLVPTADRFTSMYEVARATAGGTNSLNGWRHRSGDRSGPCASSSPQTGFSSGTGTKWWPVWCATISDVRSDAAGWVLDLLFDADPPYRLAGPDMASLAAF